MFLIRNFRIGFFASSSPFSPARGLARAGFESFVDTA